MCDAAEYMLFSGNYMMKRKKRLNAKDFRQVIFLFFLQPMIEHSTIILFFQESQTWFLSLWCLCFVFLMTSKICIVNSLLHCIVNGLINSNAIKKIFNNINSHTQSAMHSKTDNEC